MKSRLLMMIAVLVLIPLVIGACTSEASIPATPPASGQPKDVPAPPVSTGPLSPDDMQVIAVYQIRIQVMGSNPLAPPSTCRNIAGLS